MLQFFYWEDFRDLAVMLHNFWAGTKKEAKTLKMKEKSGDGH